MDMNVQYKWEQGSCVEQNIKYAVSVVWHTYEPLPKKRIQLLLKMLMQGQKKANIALHAYVYINRHIWHQKGKTTNSHSWVMTEEDSRQGNSKTVLL